MFLSFHAALLKAAKPLLQRSITVVSFAIGRVEAPQPAEFIENIPVIFRLQDHLMLVLPADVDQRFSDRGKRRQRRDIAVDVDPVFSGTGDDAADDQLIALAEPHFPYPGAQIGLVADVKQRLHNGGIFKGADHLRARPVSQQESHGPDDDRFPGAGFAGNHGQTPVEVHLQFIDDGKVTDVQFREHLHPSEPLPSGNRPIPVFCAVSPDSPGGGKKSAW